MASQISVIFDIQHDWRDPISEVHFSTGSAETLVRTGGKTNHCLIVYSLSKQHFCQKLPKSVDVHW